MNGERSDHAQAAARFPSQLPSCPGVVRRILNLCQSDQPLADALTDTITCDPALSLRILRFANSPIAGGNQEFGSISRALSVIGMPTAQLLALGFKLPSPEFLELCPEFDLQAFWAKSYLTAVLASGLARESRLADPAEAFTVGLLADAGTLALACTLPAQYRLVLQAPVEQRRDAEHRRCGVDHCEFIAAMLEHWRFPDSIVQPLGIPEEQPPGRDCSPLSRILQAARGIVRGITTVCASTTGLRPAMPESVAELMHYKESAWDCLVSAAIGKHAKAMRLFQSVSCLPPESTELIQQARDHAISIGLDDRAEREQLTRGYSQLLSVAGTDALTNISNRARLDDKLRGTLQEVSRGFYQLAVLMIDIDHFKRINDTYGHQAGDLVIKQVAATVQGSLREVDLVGRYGGEEFAVLLPNTDPQGACRVVERLRKAVEALRVRVDGQVISATISAGVAYTGDYGSCPDVDQLMRDADAQLYLSKSAGRNTWHFRGQPASRLDGGVWQHFLTWAMAKASTSRAF